jgi:hypothetical protein
VKSCPVYNSGKEAKMRRMKLALVLLLVCGVALLGLVAPVVAGQKGSAAPKPDGKFRIFTTSIAPAMGVSWGDGELSFNYQDYKFRVEAKTYTESRVLTDLAGRQIEYVGGVFNLKNLADFAGTYTHIKPEAVKAMGGTGRNPAFQNEKGVVLVVTQRIKMDYDVYVSLLGDSFKISMQSF